MKKFFGIAIITLMLAGVFTASNAQAQESCKYDTVGTTILTPSIQILPNGSIDFAVANWWEDDIYACYNAFLNPAYLAYFPRCAQEGQSLVDMNFLLEMYDYIKVIPGLTTPCVGLQCEDLTDIDFMAGIGDPAPLGAAVVDGACTLISGNAIPGNVQLFADVAACEADCGGSTGYECPANMPAYYDPAAVHDETSIDWAANGICAEYHAELGDGVLACTQPEQDEFLADMNWIITNYPFTGAVFDSQKGGDQTYQYSPDKLLCSTGEGMFPDGFFDDIYECWHGDLDEGSAMVMTFDWNVNYYAAHDAYEAYVQETYPGGFCEIDHLIMGTPTGFHAEDHSGWKYWTVRSTESCDFYGCRCDASVSLWSNGTDYFVDQVTNDSTFNMYQGSKCEDPRFVF